jgi:hypothetical protein
MKKKEGRTCGDTVNLPVSFLFILPSSIAMRFDGMIVSMLAKRVVLAG